MENSFEKISEIFKSVFGKHVSINSDTKYEDIDEWDSLSHLSLIVELEEKFELGLTPEEIENLKSVKAIMQVLKSRHRNT